MLILGAVLLPGTIAVGILTPLVPVIHEPPSFEVNSRIYLKCRVKL
jgi:hypothetical protein